MNIEEIKNRIDSFQVREMFNNDPVSFLWKYKDKRDIEVAAAICSVLAFGQRQQIYKACEKTLALMGDSPYEYIKKQSYESQRDNWNCWYRMLKWTDFYDICQRLKLLFSSNVDLEEAVIFNIEELNQTYCEALVDFFADINGFPQDTKSCCKRVNLMLRWLVRQNSPVDVGIWTKLDQSKLLLPMDVHSLNTARKYGFLKRKSNDMKAVLQVTEWARTICPDDPASLDYFLFGESYAESHPDEVMVKMTPNQMILTAVYQTMYLNELVCCCVHDMKPSMLKMDKETQKIYKAAYRRVRDYEKYMQKLMTTSGNVYVDFNDTMDCTVQPFLEKFKDELYDCINSHSNAEFPYICTLVEVARTVTRFSITEIANRVKDILKYDESAVSLYTYQQKDLMTILDNLTKWVFRKVEDINFNDYPNVVNAWADVDKAINNSDTIGAAIVKAQQMNDKYESKD